ncbi:probable helicase CHR10 isoform X3 [Macadamia integrifolia]|uniref:probable helicase CHR10 isoform X3 n=1 Tax=Macadamia integrifolia TaxID=60698 RepID=UPI001C4F2A67|nr:probable helicase CHR10 isoform X3 [Macadamia integrifolia]
MSYGQRLKAAAELVLLTDRRVGDESPPLNSAEFGVTASLKPHQVEGVSWLIRRYTLGVNVILGDEMGLGKTLQAISFLSYLKARQLSTGPFLVLCPLSVIDGWISEIANFCPKLRVLRYIGDKLTRCSLRRTMYEHVKQQSLPSGLQPALPFDILLTTYDVVLMDQDFLSQIPWHYAVIDEAQRLKNPSSVLYNVLEQHFVMPRRLLMTGTPIQNNLSELWALMHFCMPSVFGTLDQFLTAFKAAGDPSAGHDAVKAEEEFKLLKFVLGAFMLRRTKSMLIQCGTLVLPPLTEITVMAPLVTLQKKVYISILRKELPKLLAFSFGSSNQQSLQNIVVQLRKACSHPYLFPGIEPEPYEEGEHLVQDFLELRRYRYERLDGSIRAEERFAAIRSFSHQFVRETLDADANENAAFVFLISTRAGGVGLNLVAADTVVFYEQDWNPQVDKQALQRAHRIGQMNHVLSINLVTGCTVEEVIMQRAERKLQLSHNVVGDDVDRQGKENGAEAGDLRSIIFGLQMFDHANINIENSSEVNMLELNDLAAKVIEMRHEALEKDDRKFKINPMDVLNGGDLSLKSSSDVIFDHGLDEASYISWLEKFKEASLSDDGPTLDFRTRRNLPEETHQRLEAARKKAEEKKLAKWEAVGYESLAIKDPGCPMVGDVISDSGSVQFVYGDCTQPSKVCPSEPAIIFSCVDNSGNWGCGGMFDSLAKLAPNIPDAYGRAFEFGDLHLGDLHFIKINEYCDEDKAAADIPRWVALAVVQSYNPRRKVPRSSISVPDLEQCLSKASFSASQTSGTCDVMTLLELQSICHELGIKMDQIVPNGTPWNVFCGNMHLYTALKFLCITFGDHLEFIKNCLHGLIIFRVIIRYGRLEYICL